MRSPAHSFDNMRLPVIAAPMFLISTPELVVAQCKSGVVGSFPALNARPQSMVDEWLHQIVEELAAWDRDNPDRLAAPFAVNQIVHKSNNRIEADLAACAKWSVPIVITSLGSRKEFNDVIHDWGGLIFHDVTENRFARKAIENGVDGLVAVAAGAGGHAGTLSPFALIQEIREWFEGPLALSGSIATGSSLLAAQTIGADFGYIGSMWIATHEANASNAYKEAIVEGSAEDIVNSNLFTGVHGNYLRRAIIAAGLDPDNLPESDPSKMNFGSGGNTEAKAWRDIWGAGQAIGAVTRRCSVAQEVARLELEYSAARSWVAGPGSSVMPAAKSRPMPLML